MSTTSTAGKQERLTGATRPLLPVAAAGTVAATVATAVVWLLGNASDVSFLVTPVGTDADLEVGLLMVVLATAAALAVGMWLLARATRRSRRTAQLLVRGAVVFTLLSLSGPLTAAHETSAGVLLAAMHLVALGVFLVTASRALRTVRA